MAIVAAVYGAAYVAAFVAPYFIVKTARPTDHLLGPSDTELRYVDIEGEVQANDSNSNVAEAVGDDCGQTSPALERQPEQSQWNQSSLGGSTTLSTNREVGDGGGSAARRTHGIPAPRNVTTTTSSSSSSPPFDGSSGQLGRVREQLQPRQQPHPRARLMGVGDTTGGTPSGSGSSLA